MAKLSDSQSGMLTGRFAPSPTGPLHFGSLLAAMASYCNIRQKHGAWLLRIDDIDGPRSVAGSAESIQKTLQRYGFQWHGAIRWQSQNQHRYEDALHKLIDKKLVFACGCSRRLLGPQKIYPGFCRSSTLSASANDPVQDIGDKALRIRLQGEISFTDSLCEHQCVSLDNAVGDSVIWRRDKLVSYALACAVDDASDVTEVVRGADLLDSTPLQIAIMQCLSLDVPGYAHIPVARDTNGDKLSKHSCAKAIDEMEPVSTLHMAWTLLGQQAITATSIESFWKTAIEHWNIDRVPKEKSLQV